MRWLKKAYRDPVWFIITLPFKLIYLFLRWLASDNVPTKGDYVSRKSLSGKIQYEHRLIAEQVLGRRLHRWEVVHHINGRRDDNRPSNLCVMSHQDHESYHKWYDRTRYLGRYPRRATQLKKLRESFNGILLADFKNKRTRTG